MPALPGNLPFRRLVPRRCFNERSPLKLKHSFEYHPIDPSTLLPILIQLSTFTFFPPPFRICLKFSKKIVTRVYPPPPPFQLSHDEQLSRERILLHPLLNRSFARDIISKSGTRKRRRRRKKKSSTTTHPAVYVTRRLLTSNVSAQEGVRGVHFARKRDKGRGVGSWPHRAH